MRAGAPIAGLAGKVPLTPGLGGRHEVCPVLTVRTGADAAHLAPGQGEACHHDFELAT
jgi:hypothetical protein